MRVFRDIGVALHRRSNFLGGGEKPFDLRDIGVIRKTSCGIKIGDWDVVRIVVVQDIVEALIERILIFFQIMVTYADDGED